MTFAPWIGPDERCIGGAAPRSKLRRPNARRRRVLRARQRTRSLGRPRSRARRGRRRAPRACVAVRGEDFDPQFEDLAKLREPVP